MTTLIKEVGFTTDMGEVSSIKLEFSEQDLVSIRKHSNYVKNNSDVYKVVINFDAELLDIDGEEADFKTDGGELFIFDDCLYYYTQSSYEASVQVESERIPMIELLGEVVETKPDPILDARELLRTKGYFVQNLWSYEDIIGCGEGMGHEISEEQALEIMELMGRRHDATIGVNWEVIEVIIEEFLNQNQ